VDWSSCFPGLCRTGADHPRRRRRALPAPRPGPGRQRPPGHAHPNLASRQLLLPVPQPGAAPLRAALAVLFLLLHLPLAALVLNDLSSRFAEAGELGARAVRWALGVVAVDLVLLAGLSAFLGRSLQRAVPVYGGRSARQADPGARAATMTALLDRHAPNAQILLTGHPPGIPDRNPRRPRARRRRLLGARARPGSRPARPAPSVRPHVPVHLGRGAAGADRRHGHALAASPRGPASAHGRRASCRGWPAATRRGGPTPDLSHRDSNGPAGRVDRHQVTCST
jgi:hypothetical protein